MRDIPTESLQAKKLVTSTAKFSKRIFSAWTSMQAKSMSGVTSSVKQIQDPSDNQMTAQQQNWKCRRELALAYRGLGLYDMSEGVANHLSMIAPAASGNGESVLLTLPHGLQFKEVTPSSLLGLNTKCEVVEGEGKAQIEGAMIHRAVHDARADAVCVFHLHSQNATALGMLEEEVFGMYHQTHCRFYKSFAYDKGFGGAARSIEEGERLAKHLGEDKRVLFMCNHGVLVIGQNPAAAFDDIYYLERACTIQRLAMSTGKTLRELPDDIARLTFEQTMATHQEYADRHFESVTRAVLAQDPTFPRQ